jgi:cation diffusion facilitator family transporter
LSGSKEEGGFAAAWITLAIALVAEGISWLRALRQTRGEARQAGRPVAQYVRESRDPSVKMVLFEDTAALVGIVIAAVGIALHQITGAAYWDPIASIFIGVLLIAVAVRMATDTGRLLVGAAARPDEVAAIERVLDDNEDVAGVLELLTMVLGPNALLVAARVDLADGVVSERLERTMSDLDREIRAAVPDVTEVFLDPTPAHGD